VIKDVGWVRKKAGPRVLAVLRNLIIDLCSFSGTASLAAANRHDLCHTEKSGGSRPNANRRMKRP
jgi:hypothetical protein